MENLIIKWIHIVSSTILFGTGIGSAFYMFMAHRRKDIPAMYFVTRHVVIADWIFITPALIIQLITGLRLVYLGGYSFADVWIIWGIAFYILAVICWIPVVWIQIKMRDMAKSALDKGGKLPERYWVFDKCWIILGAIAFPLIIIVFYLMVAKPF